MTHGLYDANHKVYTLLKYGAKVKETPESSPKTVYFIDVDNPTNNDFAIAEEVTCYLCQRHRYGSYRAEKEQRIRIKWYQAEPYQSEGRLYCIVLYHSAVLYGRQ